MSAGIRFHWRLIQGGDLSGKVSIGRLSSAAALPDLAGQLGFCRDAEHCGIDSVLVDLSSGKPDPMVLAMCLAAETTRLKFMVAHRPGLMSPALFVQQVNTFSTLAAGRITLNLVAGHSPAEQLIYGDALAHDDRYARMEEYLSICRLFWMNEGPVNFLGRFYRIEDARIKTPFVSPERRAPEIYVGGGSASARAVATATGDCWLRFADSAEKVAEEAVPTAESGTDVGLRLACICRDTREDAFAAAQALLNSHELKSRRQSEASFVRRSDSQSIRAVFNLAEADWLEPGLWAGAVRALGATSIALVGTPEDVAAGIWRFRSAGISQFIFHGWPKLEEMRRFGQEVIPRVREFERQLQPAESSVACSR